MKANRRRLDRTTLLGALLLASCSGSSGGSSGGPIGVDNAVQGYVVPEMAFLFSGVSQMRLLIPVLLVPSMRAAAGITFDLDAGAAAPHTYDYSIPLDSDGDGTPDRTIVGTAVFSADPTTGAALLAGFQASTTVAMTVNGGMATFDGMVELSFDAGGRFLVSGNGLYSDPASGSTVSVSVGAANPLHIRTASNEPGQMANACTWSVDGMLDLDASNADGDYVATWTFLPSSLLVLVTGAALTLPGGAQEPLPDSRFAAGPCPGTGGLADWVGGFTLDWFCLPLEGGQSEVTITQIDANTIEIVDEDPPGSGEFLIYRARRDLHNPHLVHGSFEETETDGTYEEDFSWVLAPDGMSFEQVSEFFYLSGPSAGSSGICGGQAVRN